MILTKVVSAKKGGCNYAYDKLKTTKGDELETSMYVQIFSKSFAGKTRIIKMALKFLNYTTQVD